MKKFSNLIGQIIEKLEVLCYTIPYIDPKTEGNITEFNFHIMKGTYNGT